MTPIWVLALLVPLVLLTPLAYCSPPDPVWVSGFFDDDDNDNGVFFITSGTATLDAFPLGGWAFFGVSWPGPVRQARGISLDQFFSAVDVRAPPAS
ncbi:MAG TPA: hypothetical protein VJX92_00605 [Methylomirabilota bacterium]|nr:hypothetical protein [Methylomirabilota bacterium]